MNHQGLGPRRPEIISPDQSSSTWAIAGVTIALNALVNGVLPWQAHIPVSLSVAGIVSGLALKAGVTPHDQGLEPAALRRGLTSGLAAAAPIAVVVGRGATHHTTRDFYSVASSAASNRRRAYEVLLRIPFGTALPEEMIFRGTLLGIFLRHSTVGPAIATNSVLFGLWHVLPALRLSSQEGWTAGRKAAYAISSVLLTALAGAVLSVLRLRSGSVIAPWLAHVAANNAGLIGGWMGSRESRFAWRGLSRRTPTEGRRLNSVA